MSNYVILHAVLTAFLIDALLRAGCHRHSIRFRGGGPSTHSQLRRPCILLAGWSTLILTIVSVRPPVTKASMKRIARRILLHLTSISCHSVNQKPPRVLSSSCHVYQWWHGKSSRSSLSRMVESRVLVQAARIPRAS